MATKATKKGATKKGATKATKKGAQLSSAGQLKENNVSAVFHIADNVTMRKVRDLRDHDALKAIVPPQDDDARSALTTSMSDRLAAGMSPILDPLVVTEDGRIVDGMNRRAVADMLKLKEVPTRTISYEDESALIEAGIMLNGARRQLSQDQRKVMASKLLTEDATWSNRHVGRVVGLSPTTVGEIRKSIGAESDERKSSKGKVQKASSAKRRGPRNGKGKGKGKKEAAHPAIAALSLLASTDYNDDAFVKAFDGVKLSKGQLENLTAWAAAMQELVASS